MHFPNLKTTFSALAILSAATNMAIADIQTDPNEMARLVTTACLFDTANAAAELSLSHRAFKKAGLAIINEGPNTGFYGNPSSTYFISNLTDDDNVSCAGVISVNDLDKDGFDVLTKTIEKAYSARYGAHDFSENANGIDWVAHHADGSRTLTTISFHKKNGTNIASITYPPE